MSGKCDEYQANIDRIRLLGTCFGCAAHVTHLATFRVAQASTVVKNGLSSAKDLGTSYNDSGKLKFLGAKFQLAENTAGVSDCSSAFH